MSKFAGVLPDIDVGQDVFETEDTPLEIGKDAYDSDDSLHRLTLRHLQQTSARTAATTAGPRGIGGRGGGAGGRDEKGASEGSIDVGGLPRKGEVERMFRRGRKKDGQLRESTNTFRPRLPPLDPSHTDSSALSLSSASTSPSSSSEPDPDTITTTTTRQKRKIKKKVESERGITREVAAVRMRRLKLEMAELDRGLRRNAQLEVQEPGDAIAHPSEAESGPKAEHSPRIPDKDLFLRPVAPRAKTPLPSSGEMMAQLAGLRVTLEKFDEEVGIGAVGGMGERAGKTGELGEVLLQKLEGLGVASSSKRNGLEALVPPAAAIATGSDSTPANNTADLDTRLAQLERAIGAETVSADAMTGGHIITSSTIQPILPTLARLENLINLLSQPRQLDNVSRRIKFLVADLDKVNAAAGGKRGGGLNHPGGAGHESSPPEGNIILSTADKNKIDALFGLLPRIDPILPIIPPLLTRLRSLATLHADANSFGATLDRLERESAAMLDSDRDMGLTVERVELGLKKQAEAVKGNWDSLQARLVDIDKRFAALQK